MADNTQQPMEVDPIEVSQGAKRKNPDSNQETEEDTSMDIDTKYEDFDSDDENTEGEPEPQPTTGGKKKASKKKKATKKKKASKKKKTAKKKKATKKKKAAKKKKATKKKKAAKKGGRYIDPADIKLQNKILLNIDINKEKVQEAIQDIPIDELSDRMQINIDDLINLFKAKEIEYKEMEPSEPHKLKRQDGVMGI